MKEKKKKGFKLPDTYVLVAIMLIVMAALTYIVPAGTYDMVTSEATGKQVVDPNSFHYVQRTPTTILQFLMAFYTGLNKNYSTIFFVTLIGGYFKIVNETGAITNGLAVAIKRLKDKALIAIPIVMLCFAFLGATGLYSHRSGGGPADEDGPHIGHGHYLPGLFCRLVYLLHGGRFRADRPADCGDSRAVRYWTAFYRHLHRDGGDHHLRAALLPQDPPGQLQEHPLRNRVCGLRRAG